MRYHHDGLRFLIENKSGLGTAGIVVINKDQDIVECMARIARFYKHESCGQCTPCRGDGGWRILDRVVKRKATFSDIDLLSDVTKQIEVHNLCFWRRISGLYKGCLDILKKK